MATYHYMYDKGKWTHIKDPLQGKHSSTVGFPHTSQPVACLGLPLKVAARARKVPFSFNFCCTLGFSTDVDCVIWLVDFPDLIAFLQEHQAQQTPPVWLDELISKSIDVLVGHEEIHHTVNIRQE